MRVIPSARSIALTRRAADKAVLKVAQRFGTVLLFAMLLASLAAKLLVGKE